MMPSWLWLHQRPSGVPRRPRVPGLWMGGQRNPKNQLVDGKKDGLGLVDGSW